MSRRTDHFPVLALALLQGRWTRNALRKRARDLLGPRSKTRANRLVDEILAVHRLPYTPGWRTLTKIVAGASALHGLSDATIERVASTPGRQHPPRFEPIAPLQPASAPTLATTADLATWLEIPIDHLDWFADERRTLDREQDKALSHYAYHWRLKRSGAWRLIEAPKPRMMAVQRLRRTKPRTVSSPGDLASQRRQNTPANTSWLQSTFATSFCRRRWDACMRSSAASAIPTPSRAP